MLKEKKEEIRKTAEKLSKMNGFQLLLVKTYQEGIIAGQMAERERLEESMKIGSNAHRE